MIFRLNSLFKLESHLFGGGFLFGENRLTEIKSGTVLGEQGAWGAGIRE
jgi:hypothetical protein